MRDWDLTNRCLTKVFTPLGGYELPYALFSESNQGGYEYPTRSRVCFDFSVSGWQKHEIGRLVGNLGSTYDPSKPFFEILINSARHSADDRSCTPFCISIHPNKEEIEKRRKLLQSLKIVPGEQAHFSFYPTYLKQPDAFLKEYQAKLGPHATRLLQALQFLQEVTINAQSAGNCWIKQPMRGLLAVLYIELITNRTELSPKEAWAEATKLYKRIQQDVAIPFVESLLTQIHMSSNMQLAAMRALKRQKNL
jgi:hypothetical protein